MKKILYDILFGLLLFILIFIVEFAIMLLAGDSVGSSDTETAGAGLEFLLISLPAGILSFLLALFLKTAKMAEAIRRGIIWAIETACIYLIIGIGNNTTGVIFSSPGMYLMLALIFAGPLLAALIISKRGQKKTV